MENSYGFDFMKVRDSRVLDEVYRLRYKVYIEECGFEPPEDHPDEIEVDEFDQNSMHFTATRFGRLIGTIRLIQYSEKGFPIEKHCSIEYDMSGIDKRKVAEISRLAVSKDYRKRLEDRFLFPPYGNGDLPSSVVCDIQNSRRKRQEIIIGLFKAIYVESKRAGLTHWYAVMARTLHVLLQRMGIVFIPIGPEVNYHGLRTPYILSIEEGEKALLRRNPLLFKDFVEAASAVCSC